jgi:glutamate N-acetyltransferase/amino-acid N-acetyltransferase
MSKQKSFKQIPGSICAPLGFKCASVFCDIKKLGTGKGSEKGRKNDLALIVSDLPAAVAGMFTTNQVCAAPVKVSMTVARRDFARGIVVNSGNANACTGKQGMRDARMMARLAASSVAALYEGRKSDGSAVIDRRYKIGERHVLVCSTGRIGVPMPMKNVEGGIRACAPLLERSAAKARKVAEAIMTTDMRRKEIAVEFKVDGRPVRIGGICKGAGMIQPGMVDADVVATALRRGGETPRLAFVGLRRGKQSGAATAHATMLCFITTDAAVEPRVLKRALQTAVGQSFNRITVDGDMSTNDSIIALANGMAGNRPVGGARVLSSHRMNRARIGRLDGVSPHRHKFQSALNFVCLELAKMIVRDGEGVSRFVTLHLRGARNFREAELAARAIANSSLVRTSWCGGDPNWGRILCALGYSKAKIDETKVDIGYAAAVSGKIVFAFRRGRPTNVALKTLARITSASEFDLHVDLRLGRADFTIYASDLTEQYVALNKGDVNDPTTLGG